MKIQTSDVQFNFKTNDWGIFCEIDHKLMPLDLFDVKSTLAQLMALCRQATNYYLRQCWPRYMSPHGVTRPKWISYVIVRQKPMKAAAVHYTLE